MFDAGEAASAATLQRDEPTTKRNTPVINCSMTPRAADVLVKKREHDWIHVCLSQTVPPVTGGSYKYLVWDLIRKRADRDVLICRYDPESFRIAEQSDCAVCQFDPTARDVGTTLAYRKNWLKQAFLRKKTDVFLENVAEWIRSCGGRKILVWGSINALPELRRLLPGVLIAYSQRHYGYAHEVNHYNSCDVLITQTPGQSRRVFEHSVRVDPFVLTIPNGVETDQFSPSTREQRMQACATLGVDPDKLVVAFPSKIAIYKGSRYLERMIEISARALPDVVFLVIGGLHNLSPAAHKKSLKRLLETHPQVVWCGGVSREEMPELLHASDVCWMPATLREGFSMAAIEAMAAGLPVIATASGCYPEIIRDGYNGWLCSEEDLFYDFLSAIRRCAEDRELVKTMGVNARTYVTEKLPRNKVLDNYCHFLEGDWEDIERDMSVTGRGERG